MGKLRVYCLKALNKLSIYPLGNTPSAPSDYQAIFQCHGSKGSALTVIPFNQASKQDVEALIDYIYTWTWSVGNIDYNIGNINYNMGSIGYNIDNVDYNTSDIDYSAFPDFVITLSYYKSVVLIIVLFVILQRGLQSKL